MTFSIERRPQELVFRRAVLRERSTLAPGYHRLRFVGDDLKGFGPSGSDDHIRVFFPPLDAGELSDAELRALPHRDYTPRAWDSDAGVLDLEFVVHGDEGVAGPWSRAAPPGSLIALAGPRGSLAIVGQPDAWFLAGDESAIAQIGRYLQRAGENARGLLVIETSNCAHDVPLDVPAGFEVRRVHRDDQESLPAFLNTLTSDDRPQGDLFAFVAAEQEVVTHARHLLHDRWGMSPDAAVIKGYWKQGSADDE